MAVTGFSCALEGGAKLTSDAKHIANADITFMYLSM